MLVEYTFVFPLFIFVMLGTVDVSYMLYEWDLANKAAYVGARTAVVSDPVAQNITAWSQDVGNYTATQLQHIGEPCFDFPAGTSTSWGCPSTGLVTCTSTGCTPNTYGFDSSAFTNANGTGIFDRMQLIFPRLQPTNVSVSYETNGSGVVLKPGGLPMNVTVKITGMAHQFFFVPSLLRFFGGSITAAPPIPEFSTTLPSEDMVTN